MFRTVAVVTAILLITSVHIPSGEASSPSTKAKKVAADGHRQSAQSAQGSAPPISISPAKLVALPKANPLKSSSGTTTLPVTSSDILSQYALPNGSYFTHMTFDRRNSVLYAGASNLILQLNYNLSVLSEGKMPMTSGKVLNLLTADAGWPERRRIFFYSYNNISGISAKTGPKADNPQCHEECPEDTETTETTNHNKILVVNEVGSTLISCGSVKQVRTLRCFGERNAAHCSKKKNVKWASANHLLSIRLITGHLLHLSDVKVSALGRVHQHAAGRKR